MFSIRKFVVYSTLLALFSDRLYITLGINIFAFYFVVLLNLFLLWKAGSLWLPRGLLLFFLYLTISCVVGVVFGTDSIAGAAKEIFGIIPSAIYACAFIRFIGFDVEGFFEMYARFAFYVAILGFVLFPFLNLYSGRLTSVMGEPGGFCIITIPALYYYADDWQRNRKHGWRFLIILIACIMTISSIGFIGMFVALYLFGTRYRGGAVLMPAVVLLIGFGVYTQSKMFRERLDDTTTSFISSDLAGVNLSTYALVSNAFVAEKAFVAHPIIGSGLGSFGNIHERYIQQLKGMGAFEIMGMEDLNSKDAASLLIRITGELGLLGLAGGTWFLLNFWPRKSTPQRRAIAMALLCYVFLKLLRSGRYFGPEEFLFFATYAVNGMLARQERLGSTSFDRWGRDKAIVIDSGLPGIDAV